MNTPSKWIEGIPSEAPVLEAAQHVLRIRLDAVLDLLAVSDRQAVKDPETVHQLRISIRRATAALDAFKPWLKGRIFEKLRKRLRRIRRAAGETRDWDIFITAIRSEPERKAKEQRRPIRFLLATAKKCRRKCRRETAFSRQLNKKIRKGKEALVAILRQEALSSERSSAARGEDNGIAGRAAALSYPSFCEAGRNSLTKLLTELQAAAREDLHRLEALHQLRLTAKRLRYAMEIFAECFPPAFKHDRYAEVETLQQMLGNVNDSHQILLRLESLEHIGERRKRNDPKKTEIYSLLDSLTRKQAVQSELGQREFLEWWKRFNQNDFFESLRLTIMTGVEEGSASCARRDASSTRHQTGNFAQSFER